MSRINRKGGFSMAEAIIALSIIVVVSITALTLVMSSFSVRTTLITRTQGMSFADNVWECFKAADDQDEFKSLVEYATGVTPTEDTKYIYNGNGFTAVITANYDDARPYFDITVTESKDGDEIISFSYVKGAKYEAN